MDRELIKAFLEAIAVGDAYGKATEYCSREEIERNYKRIDRILSPKESLSHKDLEYGQVTDDTEQNIYLIKEYCQKKRIDAHDTALCLLKWASESPVASTMGPSSLRALTAIRDGADIESTGREGTTCGGIMRTPSAFLFSNKDTIERNIVESLKPTHYTAIAIEAAMSYGYALVSASNGDDMETILDSAKIGARKGMVYGNSLRVCGVGPSVEKRIDFLRMSLPNVKSEKDFKVLLYDILGTTLSSIDVASSIFALFIYCKDDVAKAIRIATETGGDSDTIACLAAGLSTIYGKGHNLSPDSIELVSRANNIDFDTISDMVSKELKENNI